MLSNTTINYIASRIISTCKTGHRIALLTLAVALSFVTSNVQAQIPVSVTNETNTVPNLATSYSSLADALSALNATTAMTGPVTFTLGAGTETAPNTGLTIGSASLNPVLSATNNVTIIATGGTAIVNAGVGTATPTGVVQDGILKITGADYITIDGLVLTDGNITNPATMEYGIGLFKLSASDGAQHNTIQNCVFNMQRVNNVTGSATVANGSTAIGMYNTIAAAATTALTPSSSAGTNSNNKFYTNSTNGGNNGIVFLGYAAPSPFTLGDTNNDIGGTSAGTGNTLLNFGGGGTIDAAGVRVGNQWGVNISYNTINNNNGSGVSHQGILRAIQGQASLSANADITHNTISIHGGGTTQTIYAIDNAIGSTAASNTVNINNNTISNSDYLTGTTGAVYFIYNTATAANVNMDNNTISGLTFNATIGSRIIYFMYNTAVVANLLSMNGNTIQNLTDLNTTGSIYVAYNSTSSPNANFQNNIINNISRSAAATTGLLYVYYNASSPTGVFNITGNSITNITNLTSGALYVLYNLTASTTTWNVSNNTLSGITAGSGTFYGFYLSYGNVTCNNNNLNNISSSGTTMYLLYMGSTVTTGGAMYSNDVHAITNSGASTTVYGIYTSATTPSIYKNKIYDIEQTGATGKVYGIYTIGGTTLNIYNNLIGDLRVPNASQTLPSIAGLYLSSGTTINASYNTINLAASNTGAEFSTAAVYATATPTTLNFRNNIFINNSTPNGAGKSAVFYKSSTSIANYSTSSNNNAFYAGVPAANKLIFWDGTNADQAMIDFKARVAPADGSSFSENVPFLSTVGSNPNFLHINPATPTQTESGGAPIAGITDDYDGNTRDVSTPDVGADEFTGTPADVVSLNSISINPTGNLCIATARTVTANTTAGGSDINSVTLYYSVNGATPVAVPMTGGTVTAGVTSDWTATIPVVVPANASIEWSVAAIGGVTSRVLTGTPYADEPLNGATASINGTPNPVCTGSDVVLTASVLTQGVDITVGAGVTTTSSYNAPFYSLYSNKHEQILIKAGELTAAGLGAGNISAISFPTTSGTLSPVDYTVKLAHTAASDMTSFIGTGFTQVYYAATQNQVANTDNKLIFNTPFNWDGTSNLVVDICFGNAGSPATMSSTSRADATSYVSVIKTHTSAATGSATACSDISTNVLTYSVRPKIIFTGVGASTLSSYVWNDGTNNIGTGNPFTANPNANTSYTVTATDLNGCTITSLPYAVSVIALPASPNPNNSNQCGTRVPSAFVTSGGGGGGFKWYDAEIGGSLLQNGGATYTTAIDITTTFWVSESNGNCESLRTPVTVTVAIPDAVAASVNNNNVCLNSSIQLSAVNTAGSPSNSYSFKWTASPEAGSGVIDSIPGTPLNVTPTLPGTYIYTVTAKDGECVTTDEISVTIKALPTISDVSASPAATCVGVNSTLTAVTGTTTSASADIGTQTTTIGGVDGNPYRSGNGTGNEIKTQLLVRASEMTTAGFAAGSISSLGFTTTSVGGTVINFVIKMGNTAATTISTTFETPVLTTVFNQASFTAVVGLNTHTFQTPFIWDGTSNIIVEVCQENSLSGTNTVAAFTPGYNSNTHKATSTTSCTSTTGTVVANRPIMRFTGQVGAAGPGTYNWVWNPGSLPGNTTVVSPLSTTVYTVTATDPATTCSATATTTLTIYESPAAPSGSNSEHCGDAIPTASVSSNTLAAVPVFLWYDAASGGTLLQTGTSTTYLQPVSVTTDFYVAELSAEGCEGARTLVTAVVVEADAITALVDDNSVCPGVAITLSATQSGFTNSYVYTWTADPIPGSGIPSEEIGNPVIITPTASGTYTYNVSAFDADKGCSALSSIVVTVNTTPLITAASATPSTVCSGTEAVLTAQSVPAAAGTATVGTGATTSATYPAPFYSLWSNKHEQILITAAELNSAGLVGGNITTLSFPTTVGTISTVDFTIKLAQTNATNMSAFVTTGLTQVYFAASQPQVAGTDNLITLNTPFNWNGTSNLVIDICFGNPSSSATLSSTSPADNTSYVSVIKTHTSGITASAIACPDITSQVLTYSVRPKILIGGQVGVNQTNIYTWAWNPGNVVGSTVTVNPITTTTYTATATDVNGCTSQSSPVTVNVLALPNGPVATGSTQCGLAVPTASVSTGGANGTYKWYDAQTGGNLLQTGGSTYTTGISTTTSLWVSESNATCESERTEVIITVTQPDPITAAVDDNSICVGSPIQLSVSQTGSGNTYTYSWSAAPATGSGIATTIPGTPVTVTPTVDGTYIYTVTGVDASGPSTCTVTSTVSVLVNPAPIISSVTATPPVICNGQSSTLEVKSNIGDPLSIKIGTGTTGFSGAANPYWRSGESSKNQFLYRASDLLTAGFTAGPINAMSFFVTNAIAPGINFQDFTISLAHTNLTAITTTIETVGMQLVYGPTNYEAVPGTNTHNFTTPFIWDGVSNIIYQSCYNNDPTNTCTTCAGSTPLVEYTSGVGYAASSYVYGTNTTSGAWDFCTDRLSPTGNSTQTNLPNATFIRSFVNNTSLYNWSWSNGAGSTPIVSVSPSTTTSYSVTATEPISGCTATSSAVTVTVNPTPLAPVTNGPITQCGAGPIAMTAANTGGTMNWYTTAVGGTPIFTGNNYTPTVLSSTSYWVAETYATGNCEGPRTEVVITINTAPVLVITPASSTTFCEGGSLSLNASVGSDPGYVNFSWADATGLNSTTGAVVIASPATTTTYTVTANDGLLNGCSNVTTITININPNPVITNATATPANICSGGSSTLSAVSIPAAAGTATVGAGATTNATYPSAFYSLWSNKHEQILIKASELTAAGLVTGNITTLSFPTTVGTISLVDFRIQLAQTAATTMSSFVTTGLTQVYFAASQPQVANTNNTLTLNTPYTWDGTSNLVIDICFGNGASSATLGSTAKADNTAYVSVIKTHTSSATSAAIACPDITSQVLTYSVRPQILIGGQIGVNNTANYNWVWNPGNINAGTTGSTAVTPTTTTTYTATATNPLTGCFANSAPVTVTVSPVTASASVTPATPVCAGTAVLLSASAVGGAPFTYSWSDGTATVYPATATITVSPATSTTYTVTVTDACSNLTTSTVTVTVNPLPSASIAEAGPITLCFPATQVLTAVSNVASPSYQWTLNGVNIPAATFSTYTVTGVVTGSYRVVVTNTITGCESAPSAAVVVTINQQPSAVTISPLSATTCAGSPQSLTASGGTINTLGSGAVTGTPTTSQLTTGSPYRAGAGTGYQIKQQMLIKASELNALGIPVNTPTSLNSIGFTTASTASGTIAGFEIRIGNTSATTLTSTFLTSSMTLVFTAATYSPVANSVNTHTFQTAFAWDGVSNIVIETRQTNSVTGTSGVITYIPAGITAPTVYVGTTTGFAATTGTTATFRPIMNFSFGATTPTNFTWSPPTGLNTTTGATVIASPQVTTTYTATATSALGCTNTASVTITVNPRPTGVISGGASYCAGSVLPTQLSIAVTGTSPWSGTLSNGQAFSGSSSPILVNVTPSPEQTTTYTIATLTDGLCASIGDDLSGSATVTVNPLAANPTATVLQPTCALGTGSITMTAPLGAGNSYTLDGTTTITWPTITFTGVAPGVHSITVANSFGCSAPASSSVTVDPQPFTPSAPVISGTVNVCPYIGTLEQITYTATAAGATGYTWTLPPNVSVVSGAGTGTLVVTFANGFAAQANKQLRVTANSICGTSAQTIYYLLTQYPITPSPITGATNVCALIGTAATSTYSIPASPGAVSYVWSVPAGAVITPAPLPTALSIDVVFNSGFAGGPISVTAVNGCGTSGTRTLNIVNTPASTPSLISGPTNVCPHIAPGGTAATYSIPAVNFATSYSWTVPAGVNDLTGQGTTSISFTYPVGFVSGSLSVTATNGCGTSAPRTLAVNRLNPATPSNIDVIQIGFCGDPGDRVFTYSVSSIPANAISVQWTIPAAGSFVSGQGTSSITVSYPNGAVAGTVTAQAINNCGVSTTRSTTVKLPACPPPAFTGTNNGSNNTGLSKGEVVLTTSDKMEVKIFPNPTVSDFKMEVLTSGKELINVRVLDGQGRLFKTFRVMPNQVIALGAELRAGSYLIEVRQGTEVKTTKVIKF